jgi:hypothetical protein
MHIHTEKLTYRINTVGGGGWVGGRRLPKTQGFLPVSKRRVSNRLGEWSNGGWGRMGTIRDLPDKTNKCIKEGELLYYKINGGGGGGRGGGGCSLPLAPKYCENIK